MRVLRSILCIFLLAALCRQEEQKLFAAETVYEDKDVQIVYFSDGSSIRVSSDDELLTITGEHVKSSAGISYETVGYSMTLEQTGGMVEYQEYCPITLISKSEIITDVVTTTYVLNRKSIIEGAYRIYCSQHKGRKESELRRNFMSELYQKGGLDFYLHNVFRVIERRGGSGSAPINWSRPYINLGTPVGAVPETEGILNAVYNLYGIEWSEKTAKKLPEYYDIHLKLFMERTETSIVLADENGIVLKTLLASYPVIQSGIMNYQLTAEDKTEFTAGDSVYQLTEDSIRKSYICYGTSPIRVQQYDLYREEGLKVRLLDGIVEYLQLSEQPSIVYLICEKKQETESPADSEITESEENWYIDLCDQSLADELLLRAWSPEQNLFAPEQPGGSIPVREELYAEGRLPIWLLRAEFHRKSGEIIFPVSVSRTYVLQWTEQVGTRGGKPVYESFQMERTVVQQVPVKRSFAYVMLAGLSYYGLEQLRLRSEVLQGGQQIFGVDQLTMEAEIPKLEYVSYPDREEHLLYPPEMEQGIQLDTVYLTAEGQIPQLPAEDFAALAERFTGELQVRDDYFYFNGLTCLSGSFREYDEEVSELQNKIAAITAMEQSCRLTTNQMRIPEYVKNGVYPGSAELRYQRLAGFGETGMTTVIWPVAEINSVTVHTPVYCEAVISADNQKYCQLSAPEADCLQLIPDEEGISGDFELHISNYGFHSSKQGYGSRDYAKTLSTPEDTYLAADAAGQLRNEVCFPFDVYLAAEKSGISFQDKFYPAGQWIAIGTKQVRFYVPVWVPEGCFEVKCRSVAVNGEGMEWKAGRNLNSKLDCYVAEDSVRVQISGRIYGFEVYDIADYPAWEPVFRSQESWHLKTALEDMVSGTGNSVFSNALSYTYRAGILDQYGRKTGRLSQYTLPLMEGSHPYSAKRLVKPGYTIRFRITASGSKMKEENSRIEILPHFYYLSECGAVRKEVDVYYVMPGENGRKRMVQIGSAADRDQQVWQTAGSIYLGISQRELAMTAKVRGVKLSTLLTKRAAMYSYGYLISKPVFTMLEDYKQYYYFEYALPNRLYVADRGTSVMEYAADYGVDFTENFWKKEGYLIVNFEINGLCDEQIYLKGSNMWKLEGQNTEKEDSSHRVFLLQPGDIMIFPVNSSICEDYLQGGIY